MSNRHDRRKAKVMGKAMLLTPEAADEYGMIIQNMQDAMGVLATVVKKMGGEVTIMASDLVRQYELREMRVPGGFTLSLNEISRNEYVEITGDGAMEH